MLPDTHPLAEAQAFLALWFEKASSEHWIEFRAVLPKDDPRRADKKNPDILVEACRIQNFEQSFDTVIADWIQRSVRNRYDVYFGVCPRANLRRTEGGRARTGRNEDVTHAVGAWVDNDSLRWKEQVAQEKPPATFILSSGHGAQYFFRYAEAVPIARATADSKDLAAKYGGDDVYDAARIMRVPGTRNWKDWQTVKEGLPAVIFQTNVDAVFKGLDGGKKAAAREGDISALPWDLRDVILNGHDAAQPPFRGEGEETDRSQIDHRVMVKLFSLGWSEEAVEALFRNSDYGISAKVLDEEAKGNSDNYLGVTIRSAAAKADVERSNAVDIGDVLVLEDPETLKKAPPLKFIVDRVLPAGGMLIVSGAAKTGKSLLVTDLALLLSGSPGKFLDRFQVHVTGLTVYCQAEVSKGSLKYRLNTIGASRNMLWEKLPMRFYTGSFDLSYQKHAKALSAALAKAKAKYVIIDPLARFHRKNENYQSDMAEVLSNLERAAKDAGCMGTILVHHHGKPSADGPREGVQRMRGASVIGDWGNAHLLMHKSFSDTTGRKYVRMSFELRDAEEPEPLTMMLDAEKLRFREFSQEEEKLAITLGVLDTVEGEKTATGAALTEDQLKAELVDRLGTTKTEAGRLLAKARAQAEKAKADRVAGAPDLPPGLSGIAPAAVGSEGAVSS